MKHLGIILVGILAVVGGAAFAALLIRKKLNREADVEFDDDYTDDETFEDFYGDDDYITNEDDEHNDIGDDIEENDEIADLADEKSDDFAVSDEDIFANITLTDEVEETVEPTEDEEL